MLAFSSTASNLVYGDGNTPRGSKDMRRLHRRIRRRSSSNASSSRPEPYTSEHLGPAAEPGADRAWTLGVEAVSLANGAVRAVHRGPGRRTAGRRSATSSLSARGPAARRAVCAGAASLRSSRGDRSEHRRPAVEVHARAATGLPAARGPAWRPVRGRWQSRSARLGHQCCEARSRSLPEAGRTARSAADWRRRLSAVRAAAGLAASSHRRSPAPPGCADEAGAAVARWNSRLRRPEQPRASNHHTIPVSLGHDRRHRVLGTQPRRPDHLGQRELDPARRLVLQRRRMARARRTNAAPPTGGSPGRARTNSGPSPTGAPVRRERRRNRARRSKTTRSATSRRAGAHRSSAPTASVPFEAASYLPMHAAGCISASDCWFAGDPLAEPETAPSSCTGTGTRSNPNRTCPKARGRRHAPVRRGPVREPPVCSKAEGSPRPSLRPPPLRKINPEGSAEALRTGRGLPLYARRVLDGARLPAPRRRRRIAVGRGGAGRSDPRRTPKPPG